MASKERFDLIVVGAGPGGYVAAVRGAQLGLKVACIEKHTRPGGVCLNVGCIPSKALLDSSEYFHLARDRFAAHGIRTGKVGLDLPAMMARKDKVVEDLTATVRKLMEGNGVRIVHGTARLAGNGRVEVSPASGKDGVETYVAKAVLLACGSEPVALPGIEFDGRWIVSSSEALAFEKVPSSLGIVGGGYIGLELGSVWQRLGSRVTVIEMLPRAAASLDGQVGRTLERLLKKQGLALRLGTRVKKAEVSGKKVSVTLDADGQEETVAFERLLVAVGRRPLTRGKTSPAPSTATPRLPRRSRRRPWRSGSVPSTHPEAPCERRAGMRPYRSTLVVTAAAP